MISLSAPLHSELHPSLQWLEISSSLQIPSFAIVGLAGPEVAEARERVKAAILASGFEFPKRRVVINLSPASIRKQGTGIDLAMALSVLQLDQPLESAVRTGTAWGELGLDGKLKSVGMPLRSLAAAWEGKSSWVSYPASDHEAVLSAFRELSQTRRFPESFGPPPVLLPAETLASAWDQIQDFDPENHTKISEPLPVSFSREEARPPLLSVSPSLARVLGVSAAGAHSLCMVGAKGTGKSHALEWLIALAAPPDPLTQLERRFLGELAGAVPSSVRRVSARTRPEALIGRFHLGCPRPGEFSLAHGGLLIADELPEWSRDSREALREPLERGEVSLTRSGGSMNWPARFQFAATANLCPCGNATLGEGSNRSGTPPLSACRCSPSERARYWGRLSGPVLDRIDLVIHVSATEQHARTVEFRQLLERTSRTRDRLVRKHGVLPSQLDFTETETWAQRLQISFPELSLRARHRIVRVALTLAEWDEEEPDPAHLEEARRLRITH